MKALGYADDRSVSKIFQRNESEFTAKMTTVVKLTTNGINNSKRQIDTRIFSLRGCHLIAMFARTKVAQDFRKWVLDILDKEVGQPQITSIEDLLNASLEQGKTATEICNQVTKAENISFGIGRLHGKGLNKRKKEKKILKELQAITLKWMQFKLPFIESKAV